jgi:hypothetical protein
VLGLPQVFPLADVWQVLDEMEEGCLRAKTAKARFLAKQDCEGEPA